MKLKEPENIYHVYVSGYSYFIRISCLIISGQDVYNKIDSISLEQVDKLAREDNTAVISCEMDLKLVLRPCV